MQASRGEMLAAVLRLPEADHLLIAERLLETPPTIFRICRSAIPI